MSYREIVKAAEEYLAEHAGESKSGPEIADYLEARMNENLIERHPRNVIYSYLSRAANQDESSRILSGGPHGGYSLELAAEMPEGTGAEDGAPPPPPPPPPPDGPEPSAEPEQFKAFERHLYPLVREWLNASEYRSEDVSSLKSGGAWGNPDLLGVSRIEILGASEIELVSVEVKLSESSWERFIFEAVSHKRFANRSWYCYRTASAYPPLPKNMAYYAERYRVGIIQIYLTDTELEQIARAPDESAKYLDRVQERVRALYEPVPLQEKRAFLKRVKMDLNLQVVRILEV